MTVGLNSCIHIYQFPEVLLLKTIVTKSDPSISILKQSILLYPSEVIGTISIFDCNTLKLINSISAHKSDITSMNVNEIISLVATASIKGTIIRLFSLPSGQNLYSFRNSSLPAIVTNIQFCPKSQFLFSFSKSNHNSESFINLFILKSSQVNDLVVAKSQFNDDDIDGYCNVETVPPIGGLSPSAGSKQPQSFFEWINGGVSKILIRNNTNEISTNFNESVVINSSMYYSPINLGKDVKIAVKYQSVSDIYPILCITSEKGVVYRFTIITLVTNKLI